MEYGYRPETRFSVRIDRATHSAPRHDGRVFFGPMCDECRCATYDVEHWSGAWCVICHDCGRRYVARRGAR